VTLPFIPPKRGLPICGIVSLVIPLIGFIIEDRFTEHAQADTRWSNFMILPIAALCGMLVSIIGIGRREHYRGICWFGLILTSIVLLLMRGRF